MIDNDSVFGITTIYCDSEGCDYDEDFEGIDGRVDFGSAIGEAKRNGWTMIKVDGEWEHYCPMCSEERKERK